jgi:hypothetical protein
MSLSAASPASVGLPAPNPNPARLALAAFATLGVLALPGAALAATPCSPAVVAETLAAPGHGADTVRPTCDLTLPPDKVVNKRIEFLGAAASGLTLDCSGSRIVGNGGDVIVIRSKGDTWQAMAADRPTGITIRNCDLSGGVRILGLAHNGEGEKLRQSSHSPGHTERAQAAAPTRIRLEKLTLRAGARIPVYIAPGATEVTLAESRFFGTSHQPAVYLDAESARNRIENNDFRISDQHREVIAIDGSADNVITGNSFRRFDDGGVFIYRNCGEGGTVRHQKPTGNVISNNTFAPQKTPGGPAVWLGSRTRSLVMRYLTFCNADRGYPFGSSADNGDFADGNSVTDNRFVGFNPEGAVRDDGSGNAISGNVRRDD